MTKLQGAKLRPHGMNAVRGTRDTHNMTNNMYNYLFMNMKTYV